MKKIMKKTLEKSYFRLDMDKAEYELLVSMFNYVCADKRRLSQDKELYGDTVEDLYNKLDNIKQIENTGKALATVKAHQVKRDASLKKVRVAIEQLELVKKTVTPYSVAKIAGISFVTAQKYLKVIDEEDVEILK